MNVLGYLLALLRISITRDYGMCCDKKHAKDQLKKFYLNKSSK